jgi:hypothetical protein
MVFGNEGSCGGVDDSGDDFRFESRSIGGYSSGSGSGDGGYNG